MAWRTISSDPNSEAVLAQRRAVLDAALSRHPLRRLDVIRRLCAGKRVLDVGCVDHFAEMAKSSSWLHAKVCEVASSCVGVDIEAEGVTAMKDAGYDVVQHDITEGPGPLADAGPFDVVVAGELIEHLDTPRAIFDVARAVLIPGGHLIVSTPNPYVGRRARAGQLSITWENVDHITYVPPSGIVEMSERTGGLRLVQFGSAEKTIESILRCSLGIVSRSIREPGYWRGDHDAVTPAELLPALIRPRVMSGETATYVLERSAE